MVNKLLSSLEENPVIAAVKDKNIDSAILSPALVIFLIGANISTVAQNIENAHNNGKMVLVHIDLAEGIGKDKSGIEYLKSLGVDGIISTKSSLVKAAKELGLITVKRIFTLDSQGVESAMAERNDVYTDIIEIMPGVIIKMIECFSHIGKPVIAGGLIETKNEITSALSSGAVAVSTGKNELWYL